MKKILFPLLFVVALFVVSCDFSGESNYTPAILPLQLPVKNSQDTLKIDVSGEQGVLLMDTIQVGDTVQFAFRIEAYANLLTAMSIKHTPSGAAQILLPPVELMDSIFKSNSDYERGEFYFEPLYSRLFMVFSYVALQSTPDARLEINVLSDAKFDSGFGSNQAVLRLKTPIKPK